MSLPGEQKTIKVDPAEFPQPEREREVHVEPLTDPVPEKAPAEPEKVPA